MKIFKIFILLLFSGFSNLTYGQDYLLNGDFEMVKKCPKGLNRIKYSSGWKSPTKGTPDLFHNCSSDYFRSKVLPEKNFVGSQSTIDGDAYGGLIISLPYVDRKYEILELEPYREYIQHKLIQPLLKGRKYIVKMDISLAEKSAFCLNKIQVLFSKKKNKSRTSSILVSPPNYIDCSNGLYLENKENWESICGIYEAKGEEKFITIGLFDIIPDFKKVPCKRTNFDSKNIYYYLDNITLELYDENNINHRCQKMKKDKVYDL